MTLEFVVYWATVVMNMGDEWNRCWRCDGAGAIAYRVKRGQFYGRRWGPCGVCLGWGIVA